MLLHIFPQMIFFSIKTFKTYFEYVLFNKLQYNYAEIMCKKELSGKLHDALMM